MVTTQTMLKNSSLVVGSIVQLMWGSLGTIPLYLNALKAQYNFTQTTVEMLPSMIAVGRCFTPVASLVFQNYGPSPTYLVGLILGSGGYFLLWSTTFNKQFYQRYPGFMGFYFFLIGHGSTYIYLGVLAVVTRNFSGQNQGKVVSLVEACYGATPLCVLVIYRVFFSAGMYRDDEIQLLDDFFLFKATSTACCALLCLFFVQPIHVDSREYNSLEEDKAAHFDHANARIMSDGEAKDGGAICREKLKDESITESSPLHEDNRKMETTHKTLEMDNEGGRLRFRTMLHVLRPFSSWPCQLLLWLFCITNTVSVGIEMNLSVYTKSVGLYSALDGAVIVFNMALSISRLLIGVISDKLQNIIPRLTYTAVLSCLTTATFAAAAGFPGTMATAMTISVVTGIYCGVTKAVAVTVVAKEMDERYFATYWGIFQFMSCVMLFVWQWMVSGLYQAMIPSGSGLECYGDNCVRWTFLVASIISLIATVFSFLLALRKRY